MTKAAQVLGKNVRHYRLTAKLSVQKAVEAAGMKRLTWIRIEAGKGNPHLSTIEAVAYVLKVPVNALFTALWPNLSKGKESVLFDNTSNPES